MNELKRTKEWFIAAMPTPTPEQAYVQIGCHAEEFSEMLFSIGKDNLARDVDDMASEYKSRSKPLVDYLGLMSKDQKVELLDSLTDQIVTAIGVAHTLGFDIEGALKEVNESNFSKFEGGKPVFDANGKISKGVNYKRPDLARFI